MFSKREEILTDGIIIDQIHQLQQNNLQLNLIPTSTRIKNNSNPKRKEKRNRFKDATRKFKKNLSKSIREIRNQTQDEKRPSKSKQTSKPRPSKSKQTSKPRSSKSNSSLRSKSSLRNVKPLRQLIPDIEEKIKKEQLLLET